MGSGGQLKGNACTAFYAIETKMRKADMSTRIWSKSIRHCNPTHCPHGCEEWASLHHQYHNRWDMHTELCRTKFNINRITSTNVCRARSLQDTDDEQSKENESMHWIHVHTCDPRCVYPRTEIQTMIQNRQRNPK